MSRYHSTNKIGLFLILVLIAIFAEGSTSTCLAQIYYQDFLNSQHSFPVEFGREEVNGASITMLDTIRGWVRLDSGSAQYNEVSRARLYIGWSQLNPIFANPFNNKADAKLVITRGACPEGGNYRISIGLARLKDVNGEIGFDDCALFYCDTDEDGGKWQSRTCNPSYAPEDQISHDMCDWPKTTWGSWVFEISHPFEPYYFTLMHTGPLNHPCYGIGGETWHWDTRPDESMGLLIEAECRAPGSHSATLDVDLISITQPRSAAQ